ncbi:ead/Ea22-like family protein [Enterobacter roggenkampii]|uniref:ead/Ea22-like family protein n=1 Tax=Enterobacter roggenkampii TaxID=1812935 RepID=UPI00200531D6|nr:ead/Ea22-like family protein [Enterobacter roggenkampii]MCK6926184.1 ead/Ea22-like family protein [Enterobacter roggenkampii]
MSNIDKQALRERYSENLTPKCHICGSVMTIQRAGAGSVVYGCTGRIDKDGEGYKFAEGRDFADDHYARSRVTVPDEGDPDVLALLDELEAKDKRIADLESREVRLADINEYLAEVHDKTLNKAFRLLAEGVRAGDVAAMRAAGINVSAAGKGEAS